MTTFEGGDFRQEQNKFLDAMKSIQINGVQDHANKDQGKAKEAVIAETHESINQLHMKAIGYAGEEGELIKLIEDLPPRHRGPALVALCSTILRAVSSMEYCPMSIVAPVIAASLGMDFEVVTKPSKGE